MPGSQLQIMGEWVIELDERIGAMTRRAPFVDELRKGNRELMGIELVRVKMFVDGFSKAIGRRPEVIAVGLSGVPSDERSHKELWWKMGRTVGVDLDTAEEYGAVRDSVLALCDYFYRDPSPEFWLKCLGTEFFAVHLAQELTAAPAFMELLKGGSDWMDVHAEADIHCPSHADLFVAAFAALSRKVDLHDARRTVLRVPEWLIEIANHGVVIP